VPALSALELLQRKRPPKSLGVVLLVGGEPLLRKEALAWITAQVFGPQADPQLVDTFDGSEATLEEVLDLWSTRGLFAAARVVVVREADSWIKQHRSALEKALAQPPDGSTLVLVADSEASSTRLYKLVEKVGLVVRCQGPTAARLPAWLSARAESRHGTPLEEEAAALLVERVGEDLALLDQELAKLAAACGSQGRITAEDVRRLVGSWRTQVVWELIDAALQGEAAQALDQLDQLLHSGQDVFGVLAPLAFVLRRMAAATEVFLHQLQQGGRPDLRAALTQAGEKRFVLETRAAQLRQLGRHRGRELMAWATEADAALKGYSQLPPRLVLERLLVRLSRAMRPR